MNGLIDGADRVYWWLRERPPVAGGIAVVVVALIVGLLVSGGGTGGGLPSSAIATVGGTPIQRTELAHWETVFTAASTGTTKPTPAQARTAAFELLAGSAWIAAEAGRQQVTVTDAEAAKATDTYLTQAATSTKLTQAAVLKQMGTTRADLQFQQRISLLAGKLQQKILKALPAPTSAQIGQEYNADPTRWARPTQRDVEALITATQANATAALAALKSGTTFAAVNQQYSSNSTLSGVQGKLTGLKPGSTEADVEKPIFAAPVGSLQGPLKINGAYLIFKVDKSTPEPAQTLAQATKAISTDLTSTAQSAATQSFLTNLRNRWRPKTTCAAVVRTSQYCSAAAS